MEEQIKKAIEENLETDNAEIGRLNLYALILKGETKKTF